MSLKDISTAIWAAPSGPWRKPFSEILRNGRGSEKGTSAWNRSRDGSSPPPLKRSTQHISHRSVTAPQLSPCEHRQGVAISAAFAIMRRRRARTHTRVPTMVPHRSSCIATPGRSIPVTMEALCLLLPINESGDLGRRHHLRPTSPRFSAPHACTPFSRHLALPILIKISVAPSPWSTPPCRRWKGFSC